METARLKSLVITIGAVMYLTFGIAGCSEDKPQSSTADTQSSTPSQPMDEPATDSAMTAEKEQQTPNQGATEQPQQATNDSETEVPPVTPPPSAEPASEPASGPAAASDSDDQQHAEMLSLARKSGCLACHSIDKKIVGPAWKDVAKRYTGQTGIRDQLIKKVSEGGRGNWTEVVGNVAMPPYHPRVTKENIGKLVDFVLSLNGA